MDILKESVWKIVESVWLTKYVTTLIELAWMAVIKDSKEIYAKKVTVK